MTRTTTDKDTVMKSPIQRLFAACLLLLGCVIALNVAVSLLTQIWPWVAGIGLLIAVVAIAIRIAAERRRKW